MSRYSRQQILPGVGPERQALLSKGRAAVVGLGALGSVAAEILARAGVGHLSLFDRDVLELHNLQRQSLYTEADVAERLPKAEATRRHLSEINSEIVIEAHTTDLGPGNAEHLLAPADVIVDGTDNYEARYLLNDIAVKSRKPWVYGGVLGTEGLTAAVVPGTTPCLRCVFPPPPPAGTVPTCETAGVWAPSVHAVAALEASAALQILMGEQPPPGLVHLDPWRGRIVRFETPERDPECPACGKGVFEFLEAETAGVSVRPCGGGSVHVSPSAARTLPAGTPPGMRLDLRALAEGLRAQVGDVRENPYLIQFEVEECQITVFGDGRALIKGTEDAGRARSLYARYVGN